MRYAIQNSIKIEANPKSEASCLLCGKTVISKCGDINIWHWAHESNKDCDRFSEGETLWHLDWKNRFLEKDREVIIEKGGKKHIADISYLNRVLELQNSPISTDEIQEREYFYGNMFWLFNGFNFVENFEFRKKDNYFTFRWKHPRKSIWSCDKKVFIDFGFCDFAIDNFYDDYEYEYLEFYDNNLDYREFKNKIFEVKKIYHDVPCGGWGIFHDYRKLVRWYGGIEKIYGDKPNVRRMREEVEG